MVGDGDGIVLQSDARAHEVLAQVVGVLDGDLGGVVSLHQFADGSGVGVVALLEADGLIKEPGKGADFVLVSLVRHEAVPVLLLDPSGGVLDGEDTGGRQGEGAG